MQNSGPLHPVFLDHFTSRGVRQIDYSVCVCVCVCVCEGGGGGCIIDLKKRWGFILCNHLYTWSDRAAIVFIVFDFRSKWLSHLSFTLEPRLSTCTPLLGVISMPPQKIKFIKCCRLKTKLNQWADNYSFRSIWSLISCQNAFENLFLQNAVGWSRKETHIFITYII